MNATPRPLIKWKSFWLGILVLGFLGWAWAYSMNHASGVSWHSEPESKVDFLDPAHGLVLRQEVGWFVIGWGHDPFASAGYDYWSLRRPASGDSDEPVFAILMRQEEGRMFLAHWFLMLLFSLPWSAFLVWRYRRQRKLTTNASAFS